MRSRPTPYAHGSPPYTIRFASEDNESRETHKKKEYGDEDANYGCGESCATRLFLGLGPVCFSIVRKLISRTSASVMTSRESIFSCIRTSVIFNGWSGIRRLSFEATKCSQFIPTSRTVSARSSSVRLTVLAVFTKF